jgi:hypothetical protein
MATGSCLCGTVKYRLDGPFQMMMHCHCSRCRKHHGSAFATFVGAPESGLEWLSGRDSIQQWFGPTNMPRFFCGTCGSVVPAPEPQGDLRFVPAGTLAGDLGVNPLRISSRRQKHPAHDYRRGQISRLAARTKIPTLPLRCAKRSRRRRQLFMRRRA